MTWEEFRDEYRPVPRMLSEPREDIHGYLREQPIISYLTSKHWHNLTSHVWTIMSTRGEVCIREGWRDRDQDGVVGYVITHTPFDVENVYFVQVSPWKN